MKSEERHRLQETELEKWGRHARESWESFVKGYGKSVFIGVAVACLVAVIVIWWTISSSAAKEQRWTAMLAANSAEDFAEVAGKYPSDPVGEWARLKEAEQSLNTGIQLSPINRQGSVSELVKAHEAFTKLAGTKSDLIEERRLFGLARCLETLAGVDVGKSGENVKGVDKAVEAYERFVDQFSDSIYRPFAEERIKDLKTKRAKEFYAWFREQNPNPEDIKLPEDGKPRSPGELPFGHPPISPKFPPKTATPATEDSMMQELESLVKQGQEKTNGPASAEKPNQGPALAPPK